jgi:hypothetical protein
MMETRLTTVVVSGGNDEDEAVGWDSEIEVLGPILVSAVFEKA